MAKTNTRLELTWIGKENRPKLEPRILIEDPEKSYHAAHRVSENDIFDNRLIFGDNLLALKALEQEFAGKVRCVFIDPPYNTGSAFAHYEDGIEHSLWLSLMRDRLEILRRLLSEDGSLWITIDDNECHYLKVLCDDVFGRGHFVANVIWQKKYAPANDALWLSDSHDHVLVYAKNKPLWRPFKLPRSERSNTAYKNPDDDPRGPWKAGDYTCNKSVDERPNLYYAITHPVTGEEVWPKRTSVWRYNQDTHQKHLANKLIWWGRNRRNRVPAYKRFLSMVGDDGTVPQTVWLWKDVGHTQDGKKEAIALMPDNPFATPKPEALLSHILTLATKEGDLVLDSFAGSGTAGAVAHKMERKWIMVELEDTCHTHIIPRMKKVIDGTDPGGVTETCGWKSGGGFRYYKLGPTLIVEDEWGNPVINPEFNAGMLTEAMCKLEGFTFDPDAEVYWQQGRSTETDFIYVTTQFMSKDMLAKLSDEVGPSRSLLICCSAFRCNTSPFENLTVKKIPKAVLKKCEWGHDDYSLEVENLPVAPPELIQQQEAEQASKKQPVRKFGKGKNVGPTLFDMAAGDTKGGK